MKLREEELIALHQSLSDERLSDEKDDSLRLFIPWILKHGWGKIILSEESFAKLEDWEPVFSQIFALPQGYLEENGLYRSFHGVSIGYRSHSNENKTEKETNLKEDREFVECRLQNNGVPNPNYDSLLPVYSSTVRSIYDVLNKLGFMLLQLIAVEVGLDTQTFTDITDLSLEKLQECDKIRKTFESSTEESKILISSSLLRICEYRGARQNADEVATEDKFGAHTDTTFLTLGLTSSTPALEVFDLEERRWVEVEKDEDRRVVNLFLGEYLQILTNHFLQACVHRVSEFSAGRRRVSCPLLIRGNHYQSIDYLRPTRYAHSLEPFATPDEPMDDPHEESDDSEENDTKAGENDKKKDEEESTSLRILGRRRPRRLLSWDFQGMKVKLLHLLLDRKRKKCFEAAQQEGRSKWVLSAFPISYIPPSML